MTSDLMGQLIDWQKPELRVAVLVSGAGEHEGEWLCVAEFAMVDMAQRYARYLVGELRGSGRTVATASMVELVEA